MIQHVYERAGTCQQLDDLLVATDDRRIAQAVEAFGGKSVLTRNDHESGTDRIFEASESLGLMDSDIVVNIQGDEPLLVPEMIEQLADTLQNSSDRKMATLAFVSHDREEYFNPNVVKVVTDSNGRALYFSRSPLPYFRDDPNNLIFLKHLGFYAYRQSFLRAFTQLSPGRLEKAEELEQLRAIEHGHSIHVALSPVETHGVDTPEDLEKILKMVAQGC